MGRVLAAVVGLVLLCSAAMSAGQQAGAQIGRALWLWVVLGLLAFIALAIYLWTRRELHRIHELYHVELGSWARDSWLRDWPKYCLHCGQQANHWKAVRAHDDSPCYRQRRADEQAADKEAERKLPMDGFRAEVLNTPPGGAPGSYDSFTDERPGLDDRDAPALEQ